MRRGGGVVCVGERNYLLLPSFMLNRRGRTFRLRASMA